MREQNTKETASFRKRSNNLASIWDTIYTILNFKLFHEKLTQKKQIKSFKILHSF